MNIIISLLIGLQFVANLPSIKETGHNVVYIGIENRIDIAINNTDPEDITVKVTSGNLYRRDDSTFAFNPPFEVEEFKIKLYYKKVLCQVQTMSVRKIPEPTLLFDGESNNSILLNKITGDSGLRLKYAEDIPEYLQSKIFSYNLYIKPKNRSNPISYSMRTEKLEESAINIIKNQEPGSTIIINNVLAISASGVHSRINSTKELLLSKD